MENYLIKFLFQTDRDVLLRLILQVKGVISVTFDMNKKRCSLRAKPDVKPEVFWIVSFFVFFNYIFQKEFIITFSNELQWRKNLHVFYLLNTHTSYNQDVVCQSLIILQKCCVLLSTSDVMTVSKSWFYNLYNLLVSILKHKMIVRILAEFYSCWDKDLYIWNFFHHIIH